MYFGVTLRRRNSGKEAGMGPKKEEEERKKSHKRKIKCIRLGEKKRERYHGVNMEEKEEKRRKKHQFNTPMRKGERVLGADSTLQVFRKNNRT